MRIHPFTFFQKPFMLLLSILLAGSVLGSSLASAETQQPSQTAGGILSYEAEASQNTFTGNAGAVDCGFCSGGQKPAIYTAAPR